MHTRADFARLWWARFTKAHTARGGQSPGDGRGSEGGEEEKDVREVRQETIWRWRDRARYLLSRLLLNPLEKVGSVYPFMFDCNRPLAPILRQKMALSTVWCLLTAWCLMFTRSKYLEHISRIRTEHLPNNSNTEQKNWIEQISLRLGTDNYNPVCLNVKCVKSNVQTRTSLLLQQAE
jgi:hypothetical protein